MPPRPPSFRPPVPAGGKAASKRPPKGADASGDRSRGHSRARGYDRAWERLRAWFLVQFPYCAFCLAKGLVVVASVVDHKITIAERPDLRLDPENLQSLCEPCHNRTKQREDRRRKRLARTGVVEVRIVTPLLPAPNIEGGGGGN